MAFTLSVYHITNRANYVGYSGVQTSPFYLAPTAVDGVRQVRFSVMLSY